MFILVMVACLGALTTVCHGSASQDLARLQKEFFGWQMADRPMSASYRDVHKYNDQLESYNISKMEERKETVLSFQGRLKSISETDLSKSDKVNYKILDDMFTTYVSGYEWRFLKSQKENASDIKAYVMSCNEGVLSYQTLSPVSFMGGPQSFRPGGLPFFTVGDFENYIERLTKLPLQYDEMKVLMQKAIADKMVYHYNSTSRLYEQFENVLNKSANETAFYRPFWFSLEGLNIDESKRLDIRQRGLNATNSVISGLQRLWTWMRDEYIPNSRSDIGVSSLDKGLEFYEACIRWYISVNMTAKTVHDMGLLEVERIAQNMHTILKKESFTGSIREYFEDLMQDDSNVFHNKMAMINEFNNQIFTVIEPTLEDYFDNLPELPLMVLEMPNDGPPGAYSSGSRDGSRPGIFWANVHRPEDSLNLTLMALTVHETNPGHHLQISYSITSDTPDFRQKMVSTPLNRVPFAFPRYTSYVEGWALYAEYLGEEMGLYRNDHELMGRYSSEMFRACRLVVDTGIHAFGWTRGQAIQYMLNYTGEAGATVEAEVDRYITWPGQALSYKIGEIKIRELRRKAERVLGKKFNLKEFHSVVLKSGTVPLSVLENLVNDWLENYHVTTSKPEVSACACLTPTAFVFLTVMIVASY